MNENKIGEITRKILPDYPKDKTSPSNNDKALPTFRLVAYFKPGGKQKKWMWNSEWLLNYYSVYYGLTDGTEYGAVRMKIQELINTTTRIVVYDNRSGKIPILLEYVNGKLRVDNTNKR